MIADQEQKSSDKSQKESPEGVSIKQKLKIANVCFLFELFVFVVVILVLGGLGWTTMNTFLAGDSYYYANQVTYHWDRGFITDVKISNSECEDGYEDGISYEWPGTVFGCHCAPNQNVSFVIQGYCSPSLIQKNCNNILSQDPISANLWKNSSRLCIRRSNTTFTNEQKYNGQNTICGSSNSLVVVPDGQPCPLVNVSFTEYTTENNYRQLTDNTGLLDPLYGAYNATSFYIFYTYPISQFMVSEYQFCLIDEDTGVDPEHSEFTLLRNARGCAEQGNYTTLDTTSEKDFYAVNPHLQALTSIQGFPQPGHWDYNFGYASLPSWTYSCRHNMDLKFSIPTTVDMFNLQFSNTYIPMNVTILVLSIVIIVQFLWLVSRMLFNTHVYPVGFKQIYMPGQFFLHFLPYLIDVLCKLTILGLFCYITVQGWINWNWFKSAIQENCADHNPQLLNQVLTPYSQLYQQIMSYGMAAAFFTGFVLCLDLWHLIYMYRNQLRHFLEPNETKLMVEDSSRNQNKELDFDKNQWEDKMKEEEERKEEEANDFRVTMAIIEKPKIKRKKKPRGSLFKKNDDEIEEQNSSVKPEENKPFENGFNPYMLQEDIDIDNDSIISPQKKVSRKKKRK